LDRNEADSRAATGAGWRGVLVYLVIAFGLSWAAQIALSLAVRRDPASAAQLGGGILVVAVALMWPPAVGAFVARRWVERGNFADAGLRPGPWRYLALAWFAPALLTLLALLLSLPLYPFDPTFAPLREMAERAGQTLPVDPALIVAVQVVAALTLAVPLNALFAFGEEFGWRGYLLPRLMALLGAWPGLLAHGAVWGLWHAPLIFLIGYNYPGRPVLGVPLFVVACTLLGVLFGWLRLASGSVWPPTIAHAAFNAIAGLPLVVLRGVDPAVAGVLYSPVGWLVLALAIAWLAWSGALGRALRAVPAAPA
jgi:membrane protease YdiL (CAAX protease family)